MRLPNERDVDAPVDRPRRLPVREILQECTCRRGETVPRTRGSSCKAVGHAATAVPPVWRTACLPANRRCSKLPPQSRGYLQRARLSEDKRYDGHEPLDPQKCMSPVAEGVGQEWLYTGDGVIWQQWPPSPPELWHSRCTCSSQPWVAERTQHQRVCSINIDTSCTKAQVPRRTWVPTGYMAVVNLSAQCNHGSSLSSAVRGGDGKSWCRCAEDTPHTHVILNVLAEVS